MKQRIVKGTLHGWADPQVFPVPSAAELAEINAARGVSRSFGRTRGDGDERDSLSSHARVGTVVGVPKTNL